MKKRYYLGEFEELVLLVVAVLQDSAYGLSVTQMIEKDLKRPINMSSVHTCLYRLEEKGYVTSKLDGATDKRGGRRKRLFLITAEGKFALEEVRNQRQFLWSKIPSFQA